MGRRGRNPCLTSTGNNFRLNTYSCLSRLNRSRPSKIHTRPSRCSRSRLCLVELNFPLKKHYCSVVVDHLNSFRQDPNIRQHSLRHIRVCSARPLIGGGLEKDPLERHMGSSSNRPQNDSRVACQPMHLVS